jgi:hypothetical protein
MLLHLKDANAPLSAELTHHVLSFLSPREKGRLITLSKRWAQHIWTHVHSFQNRRMTERAQAETLALFRSIESISIGSPLILKLTRLANSEERLRRLKLWIDSYEVGIDARGFYMPMRVHGRSITGQTMSRVSIDLWDMPILAYEGGYGPSWRDAFDGFRLKSVFRNRQYDEP